MKSSKGNSGCLCRKINILRSMTLVWKKIVSFGDRSISTPILERRISRRRGGRMAQMAELVIERRDLASSSGNVGVSRRDHPRVSETEKKIGDSRSTWRCHEGAWMLVTRSPFSASIFLLDPPR